MKYKNLFFGIFMIIIIFSFGFAFSQMLGTEKINDFIIETLQPTKTTPETEEDIIEDCSDLILNETAKCLRDNVRTFYNYGVTPESHTDFNTIKEKGGDCYNYAMMYIRLAKKLGFESNFRRYDGESGVFPGHRMTFMWDNETYCKLDLLEVGCSKRKDYDYD